MSTGDGIAFFIVAVAGGVSLRHGYRKFLVPALANFLLKRGKVRLAMRIRGDKGADKGCGGDCACD